MPYVMRAARSMRLCAARSLAPLVVAFLASVSPIRAVASSTPSPAPSSSAGAAPAATSSTLLAWRIEPSARYSAVVHMTHVIANDLSGIYKKLAGSKADPVTILEDRTTDLTAAANGSIDDSILDVRHYGGLQSKDASVMKRTTTYKGTLAATGKRTPSDDPLYDAGAGPLSEFPATPVAIGQSWTLTRDILVDRDLGHGSITYTDTLERIESRGTHKIAVIGVKGAGRVDVAPDLAAKGFKPTDITLEGTAEFDTTSGLPGVQHYTAHAQWNTRVLWMHLGLVFDDTFDAVAWSAAKP